jgi:hypothetical protein
MFPGRYCAYLVRDSKNNFLLHNGFVPPGFECYEIPWQTLSVPYLGCCGDAVELLLNGVSYVTYTHKFAVLRHKNNVWTDFNDMEYFVDGEDLMDGNYLVSFEDHFIRVHRQVTRDPDSCHTIRLVKSSMIMSTELIKYFKIIKKMEAPIFPLDVVIIRGLPVQNVDSLGQVPYFERPHTMASKPNYISKYVDRTKRIMSNAADMLLAPNRFFVGNMCYYITFSILPRYYIRNIIGPTIFLRGDSEVVLFRVSPFDNSGLVMSRTFTVDNCDPIPFGDDGFNRTSYFVAVLFPDNEKGVKMEKKKAPVDRVHEPEIVVTSKVIEDSTLLKVVLNEESLDSFFRILGRRLGHTNPVIITRDENNISIIWGKKIAATISVKEQEYLVSVYDEDSIRRFEGEGEKYLEDLRNVLYELVPQYYPITGKN